ncbi:SNX4 protein, partial [Polypterus senegalus]
MADSGSEEAAVIENPEVAPEEMQQDTGGTGDGSSLLKKMEISVSEAEKRTGKNTMNMQETYTVYLIETRSVEALNEGQSPAPDTLWRRYSEFELLRNYLLVTYSYIVVPPLPEKRAEFVWHKLSADNMDPDFVERRRIGLENFLLRIAAHSVLSKDNIFYLFLTQENGWKDVVYDTGFQAKRVADRLYGVYKVHGNYGRVFSEWSAIEKEMGDGLQSAGHHMDAYAASVDDILEEEEHYADQLKEYLFYSEALRTVCRKHELLQYELEVAALDLVSKKQQREELATGVRTGSLLVLFYLMTLCGTVFSPYPERDVVTAVVFVLLSGGPMNDTIDFNRPILKSMGK